MKRSRKEQLKRAGWCVGNAEDFLDLSPEEVALVEIKLALAASLRRRRVRRKLTQAELAKQLRSSQSRVAKMEAADASVSVDLLLRSLLALGATRKDVARVLATKAA